MERAFGWTRKTSATGSRSFLNPGHARLQKDKPFFDPLIKGIRSYFHEWEVETEVPDPRLYRYNQI